jgi:hypothetical protein
MMGALPEAAPHKLIQRRFLRRSPVGTEYLFYPFSFLSFSLSKKKKRENNSKDFIIRAFGDKSTIPYTPPRISSDFFGFLRIYFP